MLKQLVGAAFLFLLLSVTPSLAAKRQTGTPEFRSFEPGDLTASVKSAKAVSPKIDTGTLLWVEFANKGELHIEPLEIRLMPKAKGSEAIEIHRVEEPYFGRAGHAVPPRGKLQFPFLVPVEPKLLKGARVEVLYASASTTALELPERFVEIGKPRTSNEFDSRWQRSLDRTTVSLKNLLERPIQLTFEATYRKPHKATSLVRVSLAPSEQREFVIEGISTGTEFPLVIGADVKKLELVDWSVHCDDGGAVARDLLAAVWADWHRLPRDLFPLTARFELDVSSSRFGARSKGNLRIESDGRLELDPDGELASDPLAAAEWLGRELAKQLVRESFDELMRNNAVRLEAQGETTYIRLERAPFTDSGQPVVLGVRSGRIVSTSGALRGSRLTNFWSPSTESGPWKLLARDDQNATGEPDIDLRWRFHWDEVQGLELPVRVTAEGSGVWFTEHTNAELKVSDWKFATAPKPPSAIPSGALADRLRAAWDGIYRYPDPEAVVSGRFRFELPGNDDIWGGHELVEGRFEVSGIEPRFWRKRTFEIDGAHSDAEREVLVNAVADRFLLWSGTDFHRRPSFDVAFAGATLSEADGWIIAENASVAAVRLRRDRLDALRFTNGVEQELRLERIGEHWMVVERKSGIQRITTSWASLGEGVMLPESARFEDVFTTDDYKWGPERVEWTQLELRDD